MSRPGEVGLACHANHGYQYTQAVLLKTTQIELLLSISATDW